MAKRYTDDSCSDAVKIATTSGLTRPQLSSELGVGLSTLNKWVQQHQHHDLMPGPHEEALIAPANYHITVVVKNANFVDNYLIQNGKLKWTLSWI